MVIPARRTGRQQQLWTYRHHVEGQRQTAGRRRLDDPVPDSETTDFERRPTYRLPASLFQRRQRLARDPPWDMDRRLDGWTGFRHARTVSRQYKIRTECFFHQSEIISEENPNPNHNRDPIILIPCNST